MQTHTLVAVSHTTKKGNHDLALTDYTKVLELEPNNLFAYHNRGIAYINKKRP